MDSNRVRVALVRETIFGTTPTTPRMRTARINGESLFYRPSFFVPEEMRSDRMNVDPTKINEMVGGGLLIQQSFPRNLSALSEQYRSLFYSAWNNTPEHDNDGTADSVITGFVATTGTFTVTDQSSGGGFAGSAYKAGHLVRASGFTGGANNAVRKVTSSTTTTVVVGTYGVDETAPPATARLKVVGFEGASADITATASGLGSTVLDFTTLGLAVGQWIKIGGSAAGTQFGTAANNGWARITAIAAAALTLDNLPSGWTTDAGTGKTIRVFFGDYIRNGTTRTGLSIEKAFLGQTTPTYIIHRGMVASRGMWTYETDRAITGSIEFLGLSGAQGTAAYGGSYEAALDPNTWPVLTSNTSVGAIAEAGSAIASPNWARKLDIAIDNSLRAINALGNVGAVDIGVGDCAVTGTIETYFGSNAYLAKLLAGTVSNISARAQSTRTAGSNGHAIVHTLPRVTFTDGAPNAQGKNQDVTLPLSFAASLDSTTNSVIQMDRVEYFEM